MTAGSTDCRTTEETLERWARAFDAKFSAVFQPVGDVPADLTEAMRYSALGGGKRIRPFLVVRCCELNGGTYEEAFGAAAAIECVHAFSLVHDDLPAMDDDDLRRGRPTVHKKFGEAMAILAGDALLTLSFELLARGVGCAERSTAMVGELARGVGWRGMIGGQVADIVGQRQPPSLETTRRIHARKTGALIETACRLGALAAGAEAVAVELAGAYGQSLGRSFQIADDLLDVTSSAEQMGKSVGKDAVSHKQTYPRAVGLLESRRAARALVDQAVASLSGYGCEADDLRALAMFVVQRQH